MLRILHTNDFHGALDERRLEALLELRKQVELYFDCGDAIKAGNLAIPLKPEAAWPRLAQLRCRASVPGNRESHPLEAGLKAKLAGAAHPVLCANMRRKDGSHPLPGSLELDVEPSTNDARGGRKMWRVGVIGIMVPMVTARMATSAASQFLWDDPISSALPLAEELRPRVDCLIALTHIGHRKDLELASRCPALDLVLGGHSHTVLAEPSLVGRVAVCQAGSHGRYAGVYAWMPGRGLIEHRLHQL